MPRHARVLVDLDAVSHNVRELSAAAPGAAFCAVVKADGYGHGAVPVARAALAAGARWLGVALVEEAAQLRDAGITAPVLVLSEPPVDALGDAFDLKVTPTLYHDYAIVAAADVARLRGGTSARWAVQLKVDTGMHRVGADPADLRDLAAAVLAADTLLLQGVFTHLAVADDPVAPQTAQQLELFEAAVADLRDAGIDPGMVHAANSAATLAHRRARGDLVRCGIAMYGIEPGPQMAGRAELVPAMSVTSEVSHTFSVGAGEGVSYGLAHRFEVDTDLAVVPVGYADGVPRGLGLRGGEVLIGGVRRPIRGVVTMDQLVVEVGPTNRGDVVPVRRGDEVVLIGSQPGSPGGGRPARDRPAGDRPGGDRSGGGSRPSGDTPDEVTATEWAELMGTIAYEIVCGFSARMPREYA